MAADPDTNPYAPPEYDDLPPADDQDGARRFALASLGSRFMGALVDGLFNFVLAYAARVLVGMLTDGAVPSFLDLYGPHALERLAHGGAVTSLLASLLPFGVMAGLIAQRSQSLGKIAMSTRIVTADGRPAGLHRGFVLRTLPITAIAIIPTVLLALGSPVNSVQPFTFLTSLVTLLDVVLVFGNDRRCLHDRIAGTYVAVAGSERPAGGARKKKKKRKKPAPDA